MKNILLTGGTGLVGTAIGRLLLSQNHNLYVVSRNKPKYNVAHRHWIEADLLKCNKDFFKILNKIDIVIHAAASIPNGAIDNMEDDLYLNMCFTQELLKKCSLIGNQMTVILISSFSFLQKPLSSVITEDHPVKPITPYGISKYWGEMALFKYSENGSYRPVVFRISSPVAFNLELLHETVVKKWIREGMNKKCLKVTGRGARVQDFVSTSDIAQAIVGVIDNSDVTGIYNIASGSPISMKDLASLIARKFKSSIQFLDHQIEVPEKWNVSIAKARKDFGYCPSYSSKEAIIKLLHEIK